MYLFMILPVHVNTVILINCLDLPINVSTALHVHTYTCSSVYLFSLFLHFRHNMYPSTHLLGYVHTDPHVSPLPKNKDLSPQLLVCLPLNVPDHDPAISFSYFKYSIWLTTKIYPSAFYCSTCPQIYPFMSIPVQYFSLFSITYTVTFPLIC